MQQSKVNIQSQYTHHTQIPRQLALVPHLRERSIRTRIRRRASPSHAARDGITPPLHHLVRLFSLFAPISVFVLDRDFARTPDGTRYQYRRCMYGKYVVRQDRNQGNCKTNKSSHMQRHHDRIRTDEPSRSRALIRQLRGIQEFGSRSKRSS